MLRQNVSAVQYEKHEGTDVLRLSKKFECLTSFFEINWPVLLAYYELPGTAQGPAETARSSFGSLATRYVISVVTHFAKS